MSKNPYLRTAVALSHFLAFFVAAASAAGLALSEVYARETPSWAAQGSGQDALDLLLFAPLLVVTAFFAGQGRRSAQLALAGLLVYGAYSYLLYAFFMHFNLLFFLYIAALESSLFALGSLALALRGEKWKDWFDGRKPVWAPALYLLLNTVAFYLLWLREDIPAVLNDTTPKNLAEAGLITNPVHVLDLSFALPAMLVASVALLRRQPLGYFLYPVMTVFSIVMSAALVAMMASLWYWGLGGFGPIPAFAMATSLNAGLLAYFFRCLKKGKA